MVTREEVPDLEVLLLELYAVLDFNHALALRDEVHEVVEWFWIKFLALVDEDLFWFHQLNLEFLHDKANDRVCQMFARHLDDVEEHVVHTHNVCEDAS